MNKLKSLSQFQEDATLLSSSNLKSIKGGLTDVGNKYRWVVTCSPQGCEDRQEQINTYDPLENRWSGWSDMSGSSHYIEYSTDCP